MTSREVITALLSHEIPERVGLNEHFWPYLIEEAWEAQGVPRGTDLIRRFDLDVESVSWFTIPGPRPDLETVLEDNGQWRVTRDGWGAEFKYWSHKAGTPEHIAFACRDRETWNREFREAAKTIDVRQGCDLGAMRERYRVATAGDRFVTFGSLGVFEDLRRVLGDVVMLESLLLDPAWIHDLNRVFTDTYLAWYAFLFNEVGRPDGVHIYDDLGYTMAPFASPATHRELIYPYHRELFQFCKEHGCRVILHTCGDFRPHLPSIVEAGADCIQAMEAKTGMHVVELANAWKDRLCFMGNIDIRALESGDRDRIRAECAAKIEGMKRLRAPYVFMSDHSIPPTVALDDYLFALDVYREHAAYG